MAVAVAVLGTLSCGESGTAPLPPARQASVTVTPITVELSAVGDTARLSAKVRDQRGWIMADAVVTWSSADGRVAGVDPSGLVMAVGNGQATIKAASGSAAASATVTVAQVATGMEVSPASVELAVGDTLRLSAKATDANGHAVAGAEYSWSSASELVATVDGSGLVTAVGKGQVAITAVSGSVSGQASVTAVSPVPPEPVGAFPDQILDEGRTATLNAAEYFSTPDGGELSYAAESSDPGVASAEVSGSEVTVTATGPGRATVTVTATDPDGLSASQSFGVVVSGSVEDDFDSPASLNDWESENAEIAVTDGVLTVTNRTEGRLGIAARREMPAVNEWTIQARIGRTTRKASPGVVSLTGRSRFTAVRLVLRTLDEDDRARDRAADAAAAAASRNYEFAVFDGAAGEWVLVTNLSGGSESVLEEPGEFTDLTLGHEGTDFVAYAGDVGQADELFRFDLATSQVDGVSLGEIVSDVTGLWLVNQGAPGLTAEHDRVTVTGTGSDATPPDAAMIADAPDATTRSVSVAGPAAERAALVALFEATDGPNWSNSENWLTDAPLGDWYGVETDASGDVVSLDLSGELRAGESVPHGLSGPIPPELDVLVGLTSINLAFNELTGGIPSTLSRLANLRVLDLRANELTGVIPPQLGSLAGLQTLSLGHNRLEGMIPPELGDLANLRTLDLSHNRLEGPLLPALGDLDSLRTLDLSHNHLVGPIPDWLGGVANLESVKLRGNALNGPIPPELGGLASLKHLELDGSNLGSIPPELGSLGSLEVLVLQRGLQGSIPPELGRLTSLKYLDLSNNHLVGAIPPEFGSLANLEVLRMGGNGLQRPIPPELGGLAKLRVLYLKRNALSGSIPPELGDLPALEVLDIGTNPLRGLVPPELGDLVTLRTLRLGETLLSGRIPPELGDLTSLELLSLGTTSLSGPVPPELGKLANLRALVLWWTQLTGPLPESFLQLSLNSFHWSPSGLCAPVTTAFVRWLESIPHGTGVNRWCS